MDGRTIAVLVICIVGMVMSVGFAAIISEHLQKMARIRADASGRPDAEMLRAIGALRDEVTELRDTTTKYDISFDTALQRLESRMDHVERRVAGHEPQYVSHTEGSRQ